MSNAEKDEFSTLENVTARVIYYSCIAKTKTIPEIAALWDYKTNTYFYQETQKKLIESMEKEGLISSIKGRGGGISSNYKLVVSKEGIERLFEAVNHEISKDLIMTVYDYEVGKEQLENPMFRKYCIDNKKGLQERVNKIIFTEKDIEQFTSLWKESLFINIFLSADFIKAVVRQTRRNLPENPRELLYSLTLVLCDYIVPFVIEPERIEEEEIDFWPLNPFPTRGERRSSVSIDEEGFRALNSIIEPKSSFWRSPVENLKLANLTTKIDDIIEILVQKLGAYPEAMQEESKELDKFLEYMGYRRVS